MPKRHGSSQNVCVHNYSDQERSVLGRYLEELYRFNTRVNLTRVPEPEAWSRHIDESVELLDAVEFPSGAWVVDLGSGAGLPGIPIAVVRPDLHVTLVESDVRKSGFLNHVLGLLELSVEVINERVEVIGRGERRESFDVAVLRATFQPPELAEMALPLVKVGGMVVAMEANPSEAALFMKGTCIECGGQVEKAFDGAVVIRKLAATPSAYPRRRPK